MKEPNKGSGWGMGSGLFLLTKGELFMISRNWQSLGGAVPSESAKPQVLKHQNKSTFNAVTYRKSI